ncbi:MAG TPA: hypothetical protein VMH30_14750 [Verrucomicrobiae bacterium]|nr:hypothetical protein [Verrucomicrobiae bacterium]
MDSDKDDLAILCRDMTKAEVDRIHRLLHEWGTGPEDSFFPIQFALLTRAQLRAAASVPRAVTDSRKWLEQHLAEYRRQTQSLVNDFNQTFQTGTRDFAATTSLHAKTVEKAASQMQAQFDDAKYVARQIKTLMDSAASRWEDIRASTAAQCKQLEQVSDDLQNRFAWRVILEMAIWFSLALGIGLLFGHYVWTR